MSVNFVLWIQCRFRAKNAEIVHAIASIGASGLLYFGDAFALHHEVGFRITAAAIDGLPALRPPLHPLALRANWDIRYTNRPDGWSGESGGSGAAPCPPLIVTHLKAGAEDRVPPSTCGRLRLPRLRSNKISRWFACRAARVRRSSIHRNSHPAALAPSRSEPAAATPQ